MSEDAMVRYLRWIVLASLALLLCSAVATTALAERHATVSIPALRLMPPILSVGCFGDRGFRRTIRQHLNEVRYCYEQALLRRRDIAGREVLQLTIASDGSVTAAAIIRDELHEPALAACMVAAAARWRFMPSPSGELAVVTYPFLLRSAGPVAGPVTDFEHRADIRACQEEALWLHRSVSDVSGELALRITLDERARVHAVTITATSISDQKLLACITSAVQRWSFADIQGSTTFEKTFWLQLAD